MLEEQLKSLEQQLLDVKQKMIEDDSAQEQLLKELEQLKNIVQEKVSSNPNFPNESPEIYKDVYQSNEETIKTQNEIISKHKKTSDTYKWIALGLGIALVYVYISEK